MQSRNAGRSWAFIAAAKRSMISGVEGMRCERERKTSGFPIREEVDGLRRQLRGRLDRTRRVEPRLYALHEDRAAHEVPVPVPQVREARVEHRVPEVAHDIREAPRQVV